ncbi:MAG: PadR family transcriptional regulator [Candidatus Micrarchaeota archaeon]|nr:PadR family transcriptional regulator [Candidatus Micrarchaeota archaeon]
MPRAKYSDMEPEEFRMIDDNLRKGIANVIVLKQLQRDKTYPYAMLKKFRQSKHRIMQDITKSDIYNILNSLEKEGFVKSRVVSGGPRPQRSYTLTKKGRRVVLRAGRILRDMITSMRALVLSEF